MTFQLTPRAYTFFVSRQDLQGGATSVMNRLADATDAFDQTVGKARTRRLTLPAISLNQAEDFDVDLAVTTRWYERALQAGMRWVNQPLTLNAGVGVEEHVIAAITTILRKQDRLFASIDVTSPEQIGLASEVYSKICKSLCRGDYKGFGNFRFGIGFRIVPNTPFFPFSSGTRTGFSVAMESLPLVRETWRSTHSFAAVAEALKAEARSISQRLHAIASDRDLAFFGSDWSLAPLPNCDESVVSLVEEISGNPIGSGGSLSTIAKLTACLKAPLEDPGTSATGFNGVMLSVLEDDTLANRFLHRALGINELLLYSSVCGCGLDMIPISGDTPEVSIAEYAGDTGQMAFRLNKPLGVRLLPIAALKEGQRTNFSHDFVCNSAVVRL